MLKRLVVAVFATGVLLLVSTACAEEIVIPGTGDGVAILKAIGAAFTKANPQVKVVVPDSIGSSGGIKAVIADEAVVARVARELKDNEAGMGLVQKPFARIPAVFFVHPSVNLSMLSSDQVAAIYAGQVVNWKEVGGPDAPIAVVAREEKDSTLGVLRKSLPQFSDLKITEKAQTETKTPQMISRVERTPYAIGFGPYDVVSKAAVQVIGLDGFAVSMPNYPAMTTMRLVYKQEKLSGAYSRFVEFATSPAVKLPISVAGGIAL